MNVFVLSTGRCGSTTFMEACKHITNFTAAHESRPGLVGEAHFDYPKNHIESDHHLSWFLGRLDRAYGNDALYVHLKRDVATTAASWLKRYYRLGIIRGYKKDMLWGLGDSGDPLEVCLDYCDTVNSNIELFLRDKTNKMSFRLEHAKEDFRTFWNATGAKGDLTAALSEWDVNHNASPAKWERNPISWYSTKLTRIVKYFPSFIKTA